MRRVLALATLLLGLAAGEAVAGWWDEAGAARKATIADLEKDPDLWRDVTILLDVRFARVVEPGNPYFTRFTARDWRALAVFAPDVAADAMDAREPFTRVFVRRGSDCERRVAAVAKGRRVQLRATVRDTSKGEPWLELLDLVTDGDPLSPEESAVLARGSQLLAADNPAAAEAVLRALAGKRTFAKSVQADVWRKIGAACWSQKRIADAADAWTASLAADPDDAPTAERLTAARATLRDAPDASDAGCIAFVGPDGPSPPPPPPPGPRATNDPLPPVSAAATERRAPEPDTNTLAPVEPVRPHASEVAPPPPPPPSSDPPPPPPPPPPPRRKLSGPR